MPFSNSPPSAFIAGVFAALLSPVAAAQTGTPPVVVQSTTEEVVWQYDAAGCAQVGKPSLSQDYSDVPARPFLLNGTVMWFASNSSGNFASVGIPVQPGGPTDILASLQRGTKPGTVDCVPLLSNTTATSQSSPQTYNNDLWMVAPFTDGGTYLAALVHNEFHGEWATSPGYCYQPSSPNNPITLLCNYWNLVSALSADANGSFTLWQDQSANNIPAIAIANPYVVPPNASYPPSPPSPDLPYLPQGMTAQSNILVDNGYLYILAQQLPFQSPPTKKAAPNTGICLYRAAYPRPGAPPVWLGYDGTGYNLPVPGSYPSSPGTLCAPVGFLGNMFRFSWSYNNVLNEIILIGQDSVQAMNDAKNPSMASCPSAAGVGAPPPNSPDPRSAFVYMTATLDTNGQLKMTGAETCLLIVNSMGQWQNGWKIGLIGQAYPSLLDPSSTGDPNFQFSNDSPYLYYTRLNPAGGKSNPHGYDRDLVRVQLKVTQPSAK